MQDLPPQHEKIVIVREYQRYAEALIRRDLWREMEFQMEHTGMSLDELVSRALECYVNNLKEEQERERFYLDHNEFQFTRSEPITIKRNPYWYYPKEEKK